MGLAVAVEVWWGSSLLWLRYLTPPRSFFVGQGPCDLPLPAEVLGQHGRLPLLLVDGPAVDLMLWPDTPVQIELPGQAPCVVAGSPGHDYRSSPGAQQMRLKPGVQARVKAGAVVFVVRVEEADEPTRWRPRPPGQRVVVGALLSALLHGGILLGGRPLGGQRNVFAEEDERRETTLLRAQILKAAVEAEEERHHGEPTPKSSPHGYGRGSEDYGPYPSLWWDQARVDLAIQQAQPHYYFFVEAPVVFPWGVFIEPLSQLTPFDISVLFPSSMIIKPPSRLTPIETTPLALHSHTAWTLEARSRLGSIVDHPVRPLQIRLGPVSVQGRLASEPVRRGIAGSFARLRWCYEEGLERNPLLRGNVAIRFVVDQQGTVRHPEDDGGELREPNFVNCLMMAIGTGSFPQPESGVARVRVSLSFLPPGP